MWQICFLNHKLNLEFFSISTFSPVKCSDLSIRNRAVVFKLFYLYIIIMPYWLRSSSHEPGVRDFALPLSPLWNFWCVHVRGGAGSVPEILVSGLEILPYEHFIPVTGMKAGWTLVVRMASSCIACCIFHLTTVTRPQDLWPFLISETKLKFLIWTQGEIHVSNCASPMNQAHMKRASTPEFPSTV